MTTGSSPLESNVLFAERTPEAAARQLAIVLAHATECELATVEWLKCKKNPPKNELHRHELIAAELVFHCADLNVPPKGFFGHGCPRLAELLKQPKEVLERRLVELR